MKIGLNGIVLVDTNFSHVGDVIGPPVTAIHPTTTVPMQVSMLKHESQSGAFAVKLRVNFESQLYSASVTYAVMLQVEFDGDAPADLEKRVMVTGATMAFPYCREMLSSLTGKGRFGPVWLNPTNF